MVRLRKLVYYSSRYVFLLLVYLFPFLRNALSSNFAEKNTDVFFIANFGGLYPTKSIDIIEFIFYLVPNLILIFVFSDVMREDYLINYVYVLTRNQKKHKWLFHKAIQLFLQVFAAYVLLYLCAFIISVVAKFQFSAYWPDLLLMYVIILLLNVLSLFFMAFLQNFLSLYSGGTQSFLLVILIYTITVAAALSFYNSGAAGNFALELLVPTNQMYIWHEDCLRIHGAEYFINNPLHGFTITSSFLILSVLVLLEYWISRYIFLSHDTLEMKEA